MKATYEKFLERLFACEEAKYEYETEHDDAGYSFLPREGDTFAIRNRLRDYCAEHLDETPNKEELEHLLDWCLDESEAHSGHTFSGNGEPSYFHVDSYPVGEIESQYCFDDSWTSEVLEAPSNLLHAFFLKAEKDREICARIDARQALLYQTTDCIWIFRVHRDTLKDCLTEYREELATV